MAVFESYRRAASLGEALALKAEKDYRIAAGTTDILPQMRQGRFAGADLLDISGLTGELGDVRISADNGEMPARCEDRGCELVIGAVATHEQISGDALVRRYCAPLAEAVSLVGSPQIRVRGTIGGNLCNASPASDTAPVLTATGAEAVLMSARGTRRVPVDQLAVRPGLTCLEPDEILTEVRIPLGGAEPWRGIYHKVGTRNALMIAIADAAILYHPAFGWRIACGSVGPTVLRAGECEALFPRDEQTREAFKEALAKDICPIDDVRATAAYRFETLVNLIYQTYLERECLDAGTAGAAGQR